MMLATKMRTKNENENRDSRQVSGRLTLPCGLFEGGGMIRGMYLVINEIKRNRLSEASSYITIFLYSLTTRGVVSSYSICSFLFPSSLSSCFPSHKALSFRFLHSFETFSFFSLTVRVGSCFHSYPSHFHRPRSRWIPTLLTFPRFFLSHCPVTI